MEHVGVWDCPVTSACEWSELINRACCAPVLSWTRGGNNCMRLFPGPGRGWTSNNKSRVGNQVAQPYIRPQHFCLFSFEAGNILLDLFSIPT